MPSTFYGPANDNVDGTADYDYIELGAGNDQVRAGDSGDEIYGMDGDDILSGQNGDDTLFGDNGNDRLNGGAGGDSMFGGAGDDFYVNIGAGDFVFEELNGGIDTISTAYFNITLPANFENLILLGSTNHTGVGNALNNVITSFGGADILAGRDGDDILYSGTGSDGLNGENGNDILHGQAGNDGLSGGAGNDQLWGEEGNDNLVGGGDNDLLNGGAGRDNLNGGPGNDVLFGGTQRDDLTGGFGEDEFIFLPDSFAGMGRLTADSINDYNHAEGDRIGIYDGIYNSYIGDAAFTGVAGELRSIFHQGDTMLYGDLDGDGTADFAVRLVGEIVLQQSDFLAG